MISGESGLEAGPKASTHMGTVDCSGSAGVLRVVALPSGVQDRQM